MLTLKLGVREEGGQFVKHVVGVATAMSAAWLQRLLARKVDEKSHVDNVPCTAWR